MLLGWNKAEWLARWATDTTHTGSHPDNLPNIEHESRGHKKWEENENSIFYTKKKQTFSKKCQKNILPKQFPKLGKTVNDCV